MNVMDSIFFFLPKTDHCFRNKYCRPTSSQSRFNVAAYFGFAENTILKHRSFYFFFSFNSRREKKKNLSKMLLAQKISRNSDVGRKRLFLPQRDVKFSYQSIKRPHVGPDENSERTLSTAGNNFLNSFRFGRERYFFIYIFFFHR